jgi:23S rRNA (adenine2503-C2)-methyltransferase
MEGRRMKRREEGAAVAVSPWLMAPIDRGFEALAERLGWPAFRGRQVRAWIYGRGVLDPMAMTDLPERYRRAMADGGPLGSVELAQRSADGTVKILYRLADGEAVEAVSLPHPYGRTVCLSSQVGCKMGCAFCASGLLGFTRQLSVGEMVGQVAAVRGVGPDPLRRAVLMGMGEPMDNWDPVMELVDRLHHPDGFGIGYRHITISTVGLVPAIRRLAREGPPVRLAISLHAATDDLRRTLMPVARAYDLSALADAAAEYARQRGRRVTYEYALIRDVNDTDEAVAALIAFVRRAPGHVNLIPLNRVPETGLERSLDDRARAVRQALVQAGIPVTFRHELGSDIDAACGQLRRRALSGGATDAGGEDLVGDGRRPPAGPQRGRPVPGGAAGRNLVVRGGGRDRRP